MSDQQQKRLHAEVSHDLCVGVAMCIRLAPGAFTLNDVGQSVFNEGDWDPEQMREAEEGCPMSAITLVEIGKDVKR